jgi:uncharacterized protein YigE (DUF2233 family)
MPAGRLRGSLGLTIAALTALAGCRPVEPPPRADRPTRPAAPAGPEVRTVSYAGKRFTVCTVELDRWKLELFWRDEAGKPFSSFTALETWLHTQGRRLVFATNAGMYREDYSPVGLYVEGGRELRPLNLARGSSNFCLRPNGIFALTAEGAVVIESSRYPTIEATTALATQSGPMLVIDGELHPKFGRRSTSRLIRNGVGVVSPRQVAFAIAEDPVNFHEFATFFRDGLHCRNALYLDGSVSSLFAPEIGRNDLKTNLGPIIGVVE